MEPWGPVGPPGEMGSQALEAHVALSLPGLMDPALQLYDLRSPEEAPCTVTFHPMRPALFCGFSSGAVRSFSLEAAEVLVEHRWVPVDSGPTDPRGGS